jgi:outer membrane protein OmpA-like peptidoglycan-associated protein
VQARVWSPQDQALSPVRHVVLDVTPPQVEMDVSTTTFSPDGDGVDDSLDFALRARDRNGLARWTLEIFSADDPDNAVATTTGAFDNGAATGTWAGQTQRTGAMAGNGSYTAKVTVEDKAGNQLSLAGPRFELAADAETVVRRLPSSFQAQKTADGYRIVLRAEQVFESADSTLVSAASERLRSQILTLAKAFPDDSIVLNGRAGSGKKAAKRTELSSAQAWAFYSALVKAGVSPRRMEVHGLGGAAGEKNRLEIFLVKPAEPPPGPAPTPAPHDFPSQK